MDQNGNPLEEIVETLKQVSGVKALALGGSRARGTHTLKSDYDLGIYYDPSQPLDLDRLSEAASHLDDTHRNNVMTAPGGWGPWINGGGWLTIQFKPVDLLYRDLSLVSQTIDDCCKGNIQIYYQPGHPFGFVNAIYMGEIAVCRPLWDPEGVISRLKERTHPYPKALVKAIEDKFFWEADFSLKTGRKVVERFDVPYLSACFFRTTACLLQVLFALNQTYWLNEKGALAIADLFPISPHRFKDRIEFVYRALAVSPMQADEAFGLMEGLVNEVELLISQA
jgi:predicted nucleotidyltransferase